MQRTLQPELLDTLPHDHPDALHNRRDLRLTNLAMGNHRWLEKILPPLLRPDDSVLEIGAGTGDLGLRLAQRGVRVAGLDLCPRPRNWPANAAWHSGDLRDFHAYGNYSVIVGNLIFHQFSDAELSQLGTKICSARVIAACEPQRRRLSQFLFRMFGPIFGANYVSMHDAHVSIAAGFRGDELVRTLGLTASGWNIRTSTTLLGAHRMLVVRRA